MPGLLKEKQSIRTLANADVVYGCSIGNTNWVKDITGIIEQMHGADKATSEQDLLVLATVMHRSTNGEFGKKQMRRHYDMGCSRTVARKRG